ncbi:MAG: hypothetical protein GWO38_10355, partial [Phycisphaerae bacterium]|nr:hypothetical protein [Phycisphaerae bacterium]NIP52043.1 hypothetical protein [Phycisphaerae bacterium]NIX28010.1 hypothetical protein [Phycisphaerae bacterium]
MTIMSDEITFGKDFIVERLIQLCEERKRNFRGYKHRKLPYHRNCYLYKLGLHGKNIKKKVIKWDKCTRCVGSCFIGHLDTGDWISTDKKRELSDSLNSSNHIDWLLHLSQKRYRDHSSHQLFVGILGWFLLRCRINNPSNPGRTISLKRWMSQKLTKKMQEHDKRKQVTEEQVEIIWWMASLFHDYAYPLSHILKVVPSVTERNREASLKQIWSLMGFTRSKKNKVFERVYDDEFLKDLLTIVKQKKDINKRKKALQSIYKNRLSGYFDDDELKESLNHCYDHGLLGAAHLSALLEKERNTIIDTVIRAIGIHNGAVYSKQVNIEKDPIAFLLILCDECQEWERHIAVGDKVMSESKWIRIQGIQKRGKNFIIKDNPTIIFEFPDAVK